MFVGKHSSKEIECARDDTNEEDFSLKMSNDDTVAAHSSMVRTIASESENQGDNLKMFHIVSSLAAKF